MGCAAIRRPVPRLWLRLVDHRSIGPSFHRANATPGPTITVQCTRDERLTSTSWSISGYVCHIADNLRIWAERLQGTLRSNDREISGHDPDDLATERRYESIPLSSALWSLEISCNAWVESLKSALNQQVELRHSSRGLQRAEDIGRNNVHDANHHLWDIAEALKG